MRLGPWVLGLLVAMVAGWQLRHFILWSPTLLTTHGLLADDAFFYSVLARNFSRFGFLTLDGEMPTNGVQPLWMIVQILLVKLFPSAHEASLLAWSSWAAYITLCFLAVFFLARPRNVTGTCRALGLAGFLLLNPRFQAWVVQGLETPLCLMLFILLLEGLRRAAEETGPLRRRTLLTLGLLTALCFLARTDQFWPAIAVGLWLVLGRRVTARRIGLYLAPLGLLVIPYLAHNIGAHGGLLPISGEVKAYYARTFYRSLAQYLQSDEWWAIFHAFSDPVPIPIPYPVIWTLLVFSAAFVFSWRRDETGRPRIGLRLLACALLAHAVMLHGFYRELMTRNAYYFAPTVLWANLAFLYRLPEPTLSPSSQPRRRLFASPRLILAMVVLVAAATAALTWHGRRIAEQPYWVTRMQLADDIRRMVPAGERVAAFWPGTLAQFSGHLVTPLDGVVGSRGYLDDYIKNRRELDYIVERGRPYLAVHLPMYPDSLIAAEEVIIPSWTRIGVERIWERRGTLAFEVLATHRVAQGEGGWCLLAVRPKSPAGAPVAPPVP